MNEELKCPKCGNDCKEYATSFRCRSSICEFKYVKYFQITKEFEEKKYIEFLETRNKIIENSFARAKKTLEEKSKEILDSGYILNDYVLMYVKNDLYFDGDISMPLEQNWVNKELEDLDEKEFNKIMKETCEDVSREARRKAFACNAPICYKDDDGYLVEEYRDGTIKKVKDLKC